MTQDLYRYQLRPDVPLEEVETTLLLVLLATESLHGEAQVQLDASHFLDVERHACVIDSGTSVGRDINRLFVGFLRREFGADAFSVERITAHSQPELQEACA